MEVKPTGIVLPKIKIKVFRDQNGTSTAINRKGRTASLRKSTRIGPQNSHL